MADEAPFDDGHDDDCRHCAMARVLALLGQHSADSEFLERAAVEAMAATGVVVEFVHDRMHGEFGPERTVLVVRGICIDEGRDCDGHDNVGVKVSP